MVIDMKRDIIFNRITKVMLFFLACYVLMSFLGTIYAWYMDDNLRVLLRLLDIPLIIMSIRAFWKFKVKNIYDNDGPVFMALMVCVGLAIHNVLLSERDSPMSDYMIMGTPILIHGVWYIIQLIRKKGF